MVIGKCTDVFRGIYFGFGGRVEGGGYVGGSFLGEIYHGGKNSMKRAQDESGHVRKKRQNSELNIQYWVFGASLLWSII